MKNYAKKALSMALALLMCLTAVALDFSGLKAAAYTESPTHTFKLRVYQTSHDNNYDGQDGGGKLYLYAKNKNGTGTQTTLENGKSIGTSWATVDGGTTDLGEWTSVYWPTKITIGCNICNNSKIIGSKKVYATVEIAVKDGATGNYGSWQEFGTFSLKSSTKVGGGGSTYKSADVSCNSSRFPAASSISASNKSVTAKETGGGSVTAALTATVLDQYGVEWTSDCSSWSVTNAQGYTTSLSATSGKDVTLTVGPTPDTITKKDIQVQAKYGSNITKTINVTVTPTYKINYNTNGGTGTFTAGTKTNTSTSSTTVSYTIPAANKPTKTNTATGDWEFVGWNTSSSATSGTAAGSAISISNFNATLYAIYKKTVSANYHFYTSAGQKKTVSKSDTAYNTATTISLAVPTTSSNDGFVKSFTIGATTYTFKGWVASANALDKLPTMEIGETATTKSVGIRNAAYDYYAVYEGSPVTLTYEMRAATAGTPTADKEFATQSQTHYLVAGNYTKAENDPKSEYVFEVNPAVPAVNGSRPVLTREGMVAENGFVGWRMDGDVEKEEAQVYSFTSKVNTSNNANVTLKDGASIRLTESKVLYPVFKDQRLTVKFFDYKGDAIPNANNETAQSVRYKRTATAPVLSTNPANADHTDDVNHYVFSEWLYNGSTVYNKDNSLKITQDLNIFATYSSHKHVLDNNEVGAATCESGVNYTGTCTVCGHVVSVTEPALGHNWILDGYIEATCTRAGNNGKAICTRCGKVSYEEYFDINEETGAAAWTEDTSKHLADGKAVASSDHVWKKDANGQDKIFTEYGSCTVSGYTYKQCKFNDSHVEIVERLAPLPHGYVLDENGVPMKGEGGKYLTTNLETTPALEATCTTDGHNAYSVCKNCGAYTAQPVVIPAKGHALKHFGAVPATCLMEGNREYWYCANCEKYFTDAAATVETTAEAVKIAKTAHNYVETTAAAATCTQPGHTAGTVCSVCGDIPEGSSASETTPALGHVWEREGFAGYETLTVVDTKEATCTEKGYTEYQCSECDATTKVETDVIAHTLTHMDAKAATCEKEGNIEAWHCTVCDKYFEDEAGTVEIDASRVFLGKTDHTWVNKDGSETVEPTCTVDGKEADKVCSVCGEEKEGAVLPATGHVKTDWITTVPATCTEDGEEIKVCAKCRKTLDTRTITAPGHTIETVEAKAATCVEDGNTAGEVCTVCGYIPDGSEYSVIEATGTHTYGEPVVIAATCAAAGKNIYTCTVCGNVNVEIIDKLAHNLVAVVEAKAATCGAFGTTAGKKCTVCGQIVEMPTAIPKTPHTPKAVEDVAATCTTKGKTGVTVCADCGKILTAGSTTDMLRHEWSAWNRTEPTCTDAGKSVRTCSLCNKEEEIVIPALGHQVVADPAVAPTCENTGLTEGSHCSRCNAILTAQQEVAALGHTYEATVTAPTCTAEGYTTHTCVRCDDSYVDTTVDALGHDWVADPSRNIAPTCQDTGSNAFVCSRCGERKRETVDKVGHVWGNEVYTPATCTENGYWTYTCTFGCGETKVEETDPATGHHYENGVCTVCGAEDPNYTPGSGNTVVDDGDNQSSEKCSKCGLNHNGRTGLWKQDGFFCKIIGFFRNLFKMFG